jgi:hypothetical protein
VELYKVSTTDLVGVSTCRLRYPGLIFTFDVPVRKRIQGSVRLFTGTALVLITREAFDVPVRAQLSLLSATVSREYKY